MKAGCYERVAAVAIDDTGEEVPIITYQVVADRREPFVPPAARYLDIVRAGLNAYGLSHDALDAAARNTATPWVTDGLFVYGTLMRGEPRFEVVKRFGIECALLARAHGRLLDLGDFPGLIDLATTDSLVDGEFLRVRDFGGAVQELDRIEGFRGFGQADSLFARTLMDVDVGDGRIRRAWAYRHAREREGDKVIASGSWRKRCGRRDEFLRSLVAAHVVGDEVAIARKIANRIPFSFADDVEATVQSLIPLHAALSRGEISERLLAGESGRWTAGT